ncbi:hypothetical protein ACVWXM_005482 [Bradyrhizobium sp. GM7.3]
MRCDNPVVAVGVASWPDTVAYIEADPEKAVAYVHWRTPDYPLACREVGRRAPVRR